MLQPFGAERKYLHNAQLGFYVYNAGGVLHTYGLIWTSEEQKRFSIVLSNLKSKKNYYYFDNFLTLKKF
mgnify:CR=1 FL=1